MALALLLWNGLPQPLACLFAAIPNPIGDHLTRLAAQSDPNPEAVRFFEHKGPELVEFQRGSSCIFWIGGHQGRTERREQSSFFLIHLDTVVRETRDPYASGRANCSVLDKQTRSPRGELVDRRGSGILAALSSARAAAIQLFAIGCMTIASQNVASFSGGSAEVW
jgi:hypothetical protein